MKRVRRTAGHHPHRARRPATFSALLLAVGTLCLLGGWCTAAAAEDEVIFSRDIRPVLSDRCFQCHGPDDAARQGELRFDLVDDPEGPFAARAGRAAIVPHELESSEIWQRLTSSDEAERMPPGDSHKQPLNDQEKELIKRWILQGAQYQAFWAFVAPQPQVAPRGAMSEWGAERIDRFVWKHLIHQGVQPQPRADRRTLIRRVTFDLTGLPPTKSQLDGFLRDSSAGAYERLVDRLLASPRFGEHMAKYWLDLVRFSDTNGIHHDHYREMTPYRDWVIRSFNENLAFDRFITYQLAGDLYERPTLDQRIASGFNRLHLVIDRGTAIPAESFARNVVDRVTAFGTAFLGMTLQCAVCHDHKYDPVTQREFYELFAFFNNIDAEPETPGKSTHPPFIRLPNAKQQLQLEQLESQIARLTKMIESLRQAGTAGTAGAGSGADCGESETLSQRELELKALSKRKRELENAIPVTLVMKERKEIRPTFVLVRGAYDQPGERVERATPAFLPALAARSRVPTRMDLARWLTRADHPLTARVAVNRFWQQFFGVGIVRTAEDFGAQGEWPSHPELLDDVAVRFVQSGWDVKRLVRELVTSEVYQQSSRAPAALYQVDPQNRLLARGSRFRLDAEMIRDQILAVSGLLHQEMYGKSVKPPQPPNLWKTVSMVSSSTYSFEADRGPKIYRRSLYSFWKRALPPPQMTIFDAPTRESCIARRERTNTPLQALVLMNEQQVFQAARYFAQRLRLGDTASDRERLSLAYEAVTSQRPDELELALLLDGLDQLRTTYHQAPGLAQEMTSDLDVSDAERVEIAAYTMTVNSLFNLDVTKTRE